MNHPFAGNQIENSTFPQLRWGSLTTATTATTETATELRSELARSTTLLTLTSVTASVTTLTVATVTTATAAESTSALTTALLTHHATGRGMRPLLLDVGSGNDLGGEVEPLPEVVETLGGEGVVVVLPRELGLDVAARGQGLERLDDIEVANAGLVGRLVAANRKDPWLAIDSVEQCIVWSHCGFSSGRIYRETLCFVKWNSRTEVFRIRVDLLLRSDHNTLTEEVLQILSANALLPLLELGYFWRFGEGNS
jgi:hypothetical protein